MLIRAVLFDFDGTLTRAGVLNFPEIRAAIGCPASIPILEYISELPGTEARTKAHEKLDRIEFAAAEKSEPNTGAEALIQFLKSRQLPVGILTRNSRRCVERALANFKQITIADFDVVVSRDDTPAPKPEPDGVHLAAQRMDVPVDAMLVVGDYIFDVEAGHKAGAPTVYLHTGNEYPAALKPPDYTVTELGELIGIVRLHMPLPAGKLPNDLLDDFIGELDICDPSLLIKPGVGENIDAVDVSGTDVVVLKSDPITFTTDAIGYYTVLVNANDIATSGAVPRWLLTTLLMPPGCAAAQARDAMKSLAETAAKHGMTLCGGHMEITDAVTRPVIVGQLIGTVARNHLIKKENMRTGDCLVLTKGVAVEGTAIIARELPAKLRELGISAADIERCREFLQSPGIGVLKEARVAAESEAVTAMHGVTEGGLATAVMELSAAGRHRLRMHLDQVPVFPETERLCRALGIDPLGLIGSGSLLICCRPDACEVLTKRIRDAGVAATCIGEVLNAGVGVETLKCAGGELIDWPQFEVDEITRVFGS